MAAVNKCSIAAPQFLDSIGAHQKLLSLREVLRFSWKRKLL